MKSVEVNIGTGRWKKEMRRPSKRHSGNIRRKWVDATLLEENTLSVRVQLPLSKPYNGSVIKVKKSRVRGL